MALRPSKLGTKDKYIWLPSKTGDYSTKLGYHTAPEESGAVYPSTLTIPRSSSDFNWTANIWSIKNSPKSKFFMWKAMKEALPVGKNLKTRGINVEANCPHCGQLETSIHLLFHCSVAAQIWSLAPFKSPLLPSQISSVRLGIETAKQAINLPPSGIGENPLFPWIMWTIWNLRNKKLFENRQISTQEAISQSIYLAKEWKLAQIQQVSNSMRSVPEAIRLDLDTIICHTDAAWKEESKDAGFGWIFKDISLNREIVDRFVANNVSSPLLAEAMSMNLALLHARELGLSKLSVASDSQQLIKAIKMELQPKELYGILHDIRLLSLDFDEISFNFVSREKNSRADSIAKAALNSLYLH